MVPMMRPGSDAGPVGPADTGRVVQPRQTEVEELDVPIGPDHDVVGLDVAVDDLRGVRDGERFGDLTRDADGAFERKTVGGELAERPSLHELHRDVAVGPHRAGFVDGDDVGMVQRRGKRRLPQQPLERVFLGAGVGHERAPDDFQGDVAAEPRVVRPIHLSHAPCTELVED